MDSAPVPVVVRAPIDAPPGEELLREQVRLLGQILGENISELSGAEALRLVEELRRAAISLRHGDLEGGRDAFAARIARLSLAELELLAGAFTGFFHLINAAEEQHRIRALRGRDRADAPPAGSLPAALAELKSQGAGADDVQRLLERMLVMPVLTAHPTEARRQTVRDHLAEVSAALDRLDDPRPGHRERALVLAELRGAVAALAATRTARASRPTPLDEVRSGLAAFERSLLEVTPRLYRALETSLQEAWPGAHFHVPSFLRWGTWIGGDRDGNRFVTAETTRAALARQREVALRRARADVQVLGRELSAWCEAGKAGLAELAASLAADRQRLPAVAARAQELHASEPWREKLRYVSARLDGALGRDEAGYASAREYEEDLALLARSLEASGLARLAGGRLADVRRRAEVFGFHLATLDVRQHSGVHERAVAELLARGGSPAYERLDDEARTRLLAGLLARAALPGVPDRLSLSPETREVLDTLEVVGRARRDIGPRACERYIVSFCNSTSDLLEVLFLARAARLAPDELRPVPLLEQLEDLERGAEIATRMLELEPVRVALGGELEVMVGYSDSGKQVGYVTSQVALRKAQLAIADVAEVRGVTLTIFHGRGGAVGRGGGPAKRAILAQPAAALRGRFRVTEQGETITARYGRPEIALRDLEQTVGAVMLASSRAGARGDDAGASARAATADRAALAAHRAYGALVADPDRLARYAVAATPIEEIMQLRIASRPASRTQALSFKDLRAISWVFSWNQSRHGLPGWFGLGSGLEAVVAEEGLPRARFLYRDWPFFRGLIDNARLALTQADMGVAAQYARLATPEARGIFDLILAEHERTVQAIREVTGDAALMTPWPALAFSAERRNPYIDVVSHVQIELLARLRRAEGVEKDRVREVLFVAVNGIAAGLQSVG